MHTHTQREDDELNLQPVLMTTAHSSYTEKNVAREEKKMWGLDCVADVNLCQKCNVQKGDSASVLQSVESDKRLPGAQKRILRSLSMCCINFSAMPKSVASSPPSSSSLSLSPSLCRSGTRKRVLLRAHGDGVGDDGSLEQDGHHSQLAFSYV